MKIAKADKREIHALADFLNACEGLLEKEKFSLVEIAGAWRQWNLEDEDYQLCVAIQKELAEDEGLNPDEVDDRIIAYEFLQRKFNSEAVRWRTTVWAADILIDNCCDPTKEYLDWQPGIQFLHVENEQ